MRIEAEDLRDRLSSTYVLSMVLAAVVALAAVLVLGAPAILHDPPVTVGNARGTALVLLVIGIPALLVAMIAAQRGSLRGQIAWLGVLGYMLYNGVLFSFAILFNELFLIVVAMLGLALWSLVSVARHLDPARVRIGRMPVRAIAIYLGASALLFAVAWLSDIVPALVHGTLPASYQGTLVLTNPVHVLDLSTTLPLMMYAAVALWLRRPWGVITAGALLVMLTIETAGVAVDQWFGHLADPTASLGAVPVMLGLTAIGAMFTVLYLRGLEA